MTPNPHRTNSVGKYQAGSLVFIAGIESNSPADGARAGARNRDGRINAARSDAIIARGEIDGVEPLEELGAGVDRFAYNLECVGGWINDGRSGERADFRCDVAEATADERAGPGG